VKSLISAKVIVMVLCAIILVGTIGLYAADPVQSVEEKCDKYCEKLSGGKKELYDACYDGCMFGAEL